MRKARYVTMLLGLGAILAAGGCAHHNEAYLVPERLDHGLVFCLDGVGGYNWGPRWLREGLDEGGVLEAIYIFPWGHGPAGMFVADLFDEAGNRHRAAELACMVERFQKSWPGRPVYIIGHSGGGGIVVFALEAMSPGTQVDGVFLLAPAVSPDRNLADALRHVRGHCLVTHSATDLALMGLGTSTFGTIDRKHTVSAGLVGFRVPEDLSEADRRQYRKLRQLGWNRELLREGHLGSHMEWTTTAFARHYIAPVLMGEAPADLFKSILEDGDELSGDARATLVGKGDGP